MLEVKVWDVSHGTAVWVKLPDGRNMVVDLGADGAGETAFSPLRAMKDIYNVQQIDYAVITHGHADHLDDIFKLHQLYYPKILWTPRHLTDAEIRADNQIGDVKLIDQYLLVRQAYTGPVPPSLEPTVGSPAFCQFFTPSGSSRQNLNNHSLVLVISYCGMKVVIPGDNESPAWNELMRNPYFVAAVQGTTVLVAPHHGREAGFCGELLDLMKPNLVVISDGDACDTNAATRYSAKATGCRVSNGVGVVSVRKCVTTRKDGHISLKFAMSNNVPTYWVSATRPLPPVISLPSLRGLMAGR